MWVKLVLCFLVGVAYASHNPGWRHNHEYVYHVRGRSLTSLNQNSNNYTGILLKAKLSIRPTSDGHLGAQISDAQYANIHQKLKYGWDQEIPDSEVHYSKLPVSSETFQLKMSNGVVRDLTVEKAISNWQSNMIKGIVSQLQLDTDAENIIPSSINILTQENSNTAVFKTMEQTVTGEHETLYEIHPFPEYTLQTNPWLVPLINLKGSGEVIEVVKNKNFTHSKETPAYHFGYDGVDDFDIQNKIGEFFSRTSVSRAVITGNLDRFTVQSSVTVDQISMSPTGQDKQRGSTNSIVNITLLSVEQQDQEFDPLSNPISVGVVYKYNNPFGDNGPHHKGLFRSSPSSASHESSHSSSDESYANKLRKPRSIDGARLSANSDSDESEMEEYPFVQEHPHINEAPPSPLLPLTVGYDGQAISMKQNIKENARILAKQIGSEIQQPENIPKKNTLGKFLLLSSLLKVMDAEQMKVVADQLYVSEEHGAAAGAWFAYRDAVADAGTGPALLNIEEWIQTNRISGKEAAEIVAFAADSARQPTEKYMKVFFRMIQSEHIMMQPHLNESLILSYTTLVHQVYVNKRDSHHKYPVHSFGPFNTLEGRLFVKNHVIPHLSQKLEEALSKADTKQIHLYIRALGNVGHQQILQTFKPYLEGTKKASQFQRILMVVALDKLASNKPKAARSVLFKIYQNPRDFEQVRVAAVYQLMRANPTSTMLQRMAWYTNVDTNTHVNAAVKSVIESASNIQLDRYNHLRVAAQSAKPLLTSQDFGAQHSQGYLLTYVSTHARLEYQQTLESLGGEDSVVPKGLNYMLLGRFGGIKERVVNMQSMVSSVEDLINVYEQQTIEYQRLLKEKQAYQSVNTKWSSEYVAKLLNMQNVQREQLEGTMYLHLGSLQKMWSFDNHTVQNLTEVVKELEEELRNGKHFHYTKMQVNSDSALAFPTAWGLSFIYTFDIPSMLHYEVDIKANAKPPVYTEEGLRKPETVDAEYQIKGFVSGKVQSQFGIFTPFNHRRYSAGYDKNFQMVLPYVSGKVHFDVLNRQITLELQNIDNKKNANFLHYSSWPYTAQNEIYTPEPHTEIISDENPQIINTIIGFNSTGIAFKVHVRSDQTLDYPFFYHKFCRKDPVSALLHSWLDENIQHVEINVGIDSDKSTTSRIFIHIGHLEEYSVGADTRRLRRDSPDISKESRERQSEFLKKSRQDISNVHVQVVDTVVLFDGQRIIKYSTTVAHARSNIDPKGRVLMQIQQNNKVDKNMRLNFTMVSNTPTPPSLDLKNALKFNSTTTAEIHVTIERESEEQTEITANVTLSQSEDRKKHLTEQPQFEVCLKQMQEGNKQLPACAMLTAEANLLNEFLINVDYKNIEDSLVNKTYKLYSILRHHFYPRVYENIQMQSENNSLYIGGQFSPDLSTVNTSIRSDYGYVEVSNVYVNDWFRNFIVTHPVHRVKTRVGGYALNYDTYQPFCVIDKTAANSFDNKTFPVSLSNDWVVLLHYVPRRPSSIKNQPKQTVGEQLNEQVEGYITYARAYGSDKSKKEIKMVIQSPHTLGKVIDVSFKPAESSGYPRLYIQNEQIIYDDKGKHIYDDYMQVYKLPDGEVKAEVFDSFYVVYDGVRAKLTLINDKYRDASRGLCGTFTDEPETDFTHPGNCIFHSSDEFVASNTIPDRPRSKRMYDMARLRDEEKKCYQKSIEYVKVVSAEDSGLTGDDGYPFRSRSQSNIQAQTKYVTLGRETCFSVLPLPTCKRGYKQYESESKSVPVHCVAATRLATSYKKQIDNGANPSFKSKTHNREVMMTVAKRCEP